MIMEAKPEKMETEEEAAPQEDAAAEASGRDVSPEEKIKQLEEEIATLRDQRIRALAETDNVRKRAQRDQEDIARYAVAGFARDMVNVLENLSRATESLEAHKEQSSEELLKTFAEGIALTKRELLAIFEKFHITRINPQGQKFDHNLHQAVAQVERADLPPGTVVQVVQAGYVIHDRLLRPAMVTVSKQGDPPKTVDTSA
jgi:molecular chaperone GrpE